MSISLALSPLGAIPDYTALKEWLAEEVDRDLPSIEDRLEKCIQMAETYFNRTLRAPQMERTSTGSVDTEDTTFPEDYLAMRAIYEEGSPDRPLRGIAPTTIRQGYDGSTGIPTAYTLVSNGIRLIPPPSGTISLTMDYFARIDRLTVSTPVNWLLDQHPDLYVYGSLFHYYRWALNREAAIDAKSLRDEAVEHLNKTSRNDRYGAGPLVPNTVGQVRHSRC